MTHILYKNGLFVLIFCSLLFGQQNMEQLTLNKAIAVCLEKNFDIQLSKIDAEIADNDASLGNAGMLPKIVLSGSKSESNVDSKQSFLSGNVIDRKNAESSATTGGVALNWTIFDGLKMFVSFVRLQEIKKVGELELKSTIETTLDEVIKLYFEIVQQKERLISLKDALTLSEERTKIVESQYGFGSASKLDLLNARVDLNSDRAAVLQQDVILNRVKTDLNQLIVLPSDFSFDVADSIVIDTELVLEHLLNQARSFNTRLRIADQNQHIARLEKQAIVSERLPSVSVNAAYNINRSTSQSGFINSNQTEGLNYGMNLSFPLFDGFNIHRRQQNAELSRQKWMTEYEKTASAIEADITRAYVSYANYIKQSEIEKDNTKAAREFMEISFARYKVGTLTALEWREAQLKYLDAVNRMIAAQYLAKYAETDLKRLSGQLVEQAEAAGSTANSN